MTDKGWYSELTESQRDRENRRRRNVRRGRGAPEHTLTREQWYARQGLTPPPLPNQKAA